MKLEQKYLDICYKNAMIMQYTEKLQQQGFSVVVEKQSPADLYAEKEDEKRIYEFKYYGNKRYDRGAISRIKKYADSIDAKLFMVYISRYKEKDIIFDNLDIKLTSFMANDELPSKLNSLSTHTVICEVNIDSINYINITDSIKVSGNATISVELQFGSNADCRNDDGVISTDSFPMIFDIELDTELNIHSCHVEIDTDDYYK